MSATQQAEIMYPEKSNREYLQHNDELQAAFIAGAEWQAQQSEAAIQEIGKQCYEQGAADGTPWIKITPETMGKVIKGKYYQVCTEGTQQQYVAYRNNKAEWKLGDGTEVKGITHFSELKPIPKTE